MLDAILIKGFKSIASIEEKLEPVNIVIGANGAGKSNFLGAFAFLQAISEGRLQNYVVSAGGADKVLHFGSKATKEVEFRLAFREDDGYQLKLSPTGSDGLFPSAEFLFVNEGNPKVALGLPTRHEGREAGLSDSKLISIRRHVSDWRLYHLNDTSSSSPLCKTARVDDNRFLRPDGSNLPAFLYYLRQRHNAAYDLIQRTVQRVAPFFDDFRLDPLLLSPEDIKLEWQHKRSDQYFDASSLSDGTLRFIVLATLFLQPEELRPSVILVDEPELGLHPHAIETLAALIRQASVTTQVIVSTQSTLLLDHFKPEDVLVADRVNGGTQLKRLESSHLKSWLDDYSLGQLWEKNEFGGQPVPG